MNLVAFSLKTKGANNFRRRLWTVFTRFGISETRTNQALHTIMAILKEYNGAPTFFIPAVVLGRHVALMETIAEQGVEIGIHGYVHNDYRTLNPAAQYAQIWKAISAFQKANVLYHGFRNPYLGWTEEAVQVFAELGLAYDSNEAVLHDVVDLESVQPAIREGYRKSLKLFQAIPCNAYTLRPHFEGPLLRIPTSIPDDEMLFDRLRITSPKEVGSVWSRVMHRVYDLGGIYTLNLHPERGVLCGPALKMLLAYAHNQPLPVWTVRLEDVARWWQERSQFRLKVVAQGDQWWKIEATCTPRATLLARHLTVEDQPTTSWVDGEVRVLAHRCEVRATHCPCIGLSDQTPQDVLDFLYEQGYPAMRAASTEASTYAMFLDMPEGLGVDRESRAKKCSALVEQIEQLNAPFIRFGCWPDGRRAALAISGDIDSITIQDFFLRILEVRQRA